MKFYKFRSLASSDDYERAKQIIESEKFWCSTFSELNDPMEGVFACGADEETISRINDIYRDKKAYKICSFSGQKALLNPAMWGYYSNGFKGIAIEVAPDAGRVLRKIKYTQCAPSFDHNSEIGDAAEILTTKLRSWRHEVEYRFLTKLSSNEQRIGTITAIYFGCPYEDVVNAHDVYRDSMHLNKYRALKQRLIKVIPEHITCYSTFIKNDKVAWRKSTI